MDIADPQIAPNMDTVTVTGRQINKNFKLIFLSIFLLHHTGDVNRIHIRFEF